MMIKIMMKMMSILILMIKIYWVEYPMMINFKMTMNTMISLTAKMRMKILTWFNFTNSRILMQVIKAQHPQGQSKFQFPDLVWVEVVDSLILVVLVCLNNRNSKINVNNQRNWYCKQIYLSFKRNIRIKEYKIVLKCK